MATPRPPCIYVVTVVPCCLAPSARADLLDRATYVATTKDWWGGRFNEDIGIVWLSDTSLVHVRASGSWDGVHGEPRSHYHRTAYLFDLRTRRDRRLPGLTRALDRLDPEIAFGPDVSPDGKWLLWSERWGRCLLAEVSGGRSHLYPLNRDMADRSVAWFRDSRRWLECFYWSGDLERVVLHDVRHPRLAKLYPMSGKTRLPLGLARTLASERTVTVIGSNDNTGKSVYGFVTAYAGSIDPTTEDRKIAYFAIPQHARDYSEAISPRGDAIAWAVTAPSSDHWWRYELWVSDVYGRNMRPVGGLGRSADRNVLATYRLDLQWLPSGRRLSFVYDDRLYTVPVPPRAAHAR